MHIKGDPQNLALKIGKKYQLLLVYNIQYVIFRQVVSECVKDQKELSRTSHCLGLLGDSLSVVCPQQGKANI